MTAAPEITVLTAVYNGELYLRETIDSIIAQTLEDWEYIIVDDGSTDGTLQIIEEAIQRDRRIRMIRRSTSGGPYVAANEGVQAARGKWVVRTDADDLSPAHRLKRQRDFLISHPQYRACVSFWQAFDRTGLIPNSVTTIPEHSGAFCWYLMLRAPSIHSAVCYERGAILEIGGYRELPLSQDYRLWCELSRRGWLGTIPEVLSYVRFHENRSTLTRKRLQRELALDVLRDHLRIVACQDWSPDEVETLWAVGHCESMPLGRGLEMLDRWDRLWKAADDLTPEDRAELRRLSALRRWKHIRSNARRQPLDAIFNLIRLGATRPWSIIPGPSPIT